MVGGTHLELVSPTIGIVVLGLLNSAIGSTPTNRNLLPMGLKSTRHLLWPFLLAGARWPSIDPPFTLPSPCASSSPPLPSYFSSSSLPLPSSSSPRPLRPSF